MSYTDQRSYIGPATLAAQNLVSTASGAVVYGATTVLLPCAEATWICSIGALVTTTPTAPGAGVRAFVVVGTSTTTSTGSITQSSGSGGVCTFIPSVPVGPGTPFGVGLLGTGTAVATGTFGASTLIVGVAPQFT